MALPSATSKAIQWEMDWFWDFFVPETMAFYHQHTGSSCKFSLNTNAMIQAKRWMGRVSAVIWTRDTSTRNLLDSAHTSHCSSRLLFISHFRWINSCRLIYTSMYSNYKLYMCIYIFSWIFGYVSNLGPSHGLSSSQFLPMATFPHLSDGEMHHLAVITDCQLSSVVESLLHQGPRRPRAGTRTAREFMAVFGEKSTINGCFYGKIHYNWRFWWENHQNGGLNDPSEFWRAFAMRDLPSKGKAPKWDNWLGESISAEERLQRNSIHHPGMIQDTCDVTKKTNWNADDASPRNIYIYIYT